MRRDAVHQSLEPVYEGPSFVIAPEPKVFFVERNDRTESIQ